jgi:predicted peroxiredoxin
MQSAEDVARAEEAEAAFHARLNAARHELETTVNPFERYKAATIVERMTCNRVDVPNFPDDHLWLGNLDNRHYPDLERYMKRCRRLWREQVVNASSR